jgi:hypothetical protein
MFLTGWIGRILKFKINLSESSGIPTTYHCDQINLRMKYEHENFEYLVLALAHKFFFLSKDEKKNYTPERVLEYAEFLNIPRQLD